MSTHKHTHTSVFVRARARARACVCVVKGTCVDGTTAKPASHSSMSAEATMRRVSGRDDARGATLRPRLSGGVNALAHAASAVTITTIRGGPHILGGRFSSYELQFAQHAVPEVAPAGGKKNGQPPRPRLAFLPADGGVRSLRICPLAGCGTESPGDDVTCRLAAGCGPLTAPAPHPPCSCRLRSSAVRPCSRRSSGPAPLGRVPPPSVGVPHARSCRFCACLEVRREDASALASS
jgi:hypothetical protein